MKMFYTLLFFIIAGFSQPSMAEYTSCTAAMQKFEDSYLPVNAAIREKINSCNSVCQITPNYKNSQDFCGVDDCKLQVSRTGKISPWCARLAKYWNNKLGSIENPLAAIYDSSSRVDFLSCVESFSGSGGMVNECCAKLPEIKKYDQQLGKSAEEYCSLKRSAQVCTAQFNQAHKFNHACCTYADANDGKLAGKNHFDDYRDLAEQIEKAIPISCKPVYRGVDRSLHSCTENFRNTGKFNGDCCIAFYNGTLIPHKEGMNYTSLDMFCFPDNYR